MGLIDSNYLYESVEREYCMRCRYLSSSECEHCDINDILVLIDGSPRVDAVPVVHGKWEIRTTEAVKGDVTYIVHKYFCSECGKQAEHFFKYCPNCGAKMNV